MGRRTPCNVEVTLKPGESQDKLLKRFMKKCKKVDIVKEYLDKTSYFKTNREKKREKRIKNQWLKNSKKTVKRTK